VNKGERISFVFGLWFTALIAFVCTGLYAAEASNSDYALIGPKIWLALYIVVIWQLYGGMDYFGHSLVGGIVTTLILYGIWWMSAPYSALQAVTITFMVGGFAFEVYIYLKCIYFGLKEKTKKTA
jgi:hypothetical protein